MTLTCCEDRVITRPGKRWLGDGSAVKTLLTLLLVVSPAIARAQAFEPTMDPQPPSQVRPETPVAEKSESTALALSLGTTLGGVALIGIAQSSHGSERDTLSSIGAVAATIGPTLGHAYADDVINGGLGMRLAGTGVVIAGAMVAFSACPIFDPCGPGQQSTKDFGGVLIAGGALLYGAGLVYEIATAPIAAREYNRTHHASAALTIAPIRTRDGTSPGFAFVGRF
ncbi:MAG: hypothetical protein JWO36_6843 [Myxococcales bacterium]|nr:hypothetical protein [Myxococcales bacterium]